MIVHKRFPPSDIVKEYINLYLVNIVMGSKLFSKY